MGLVAASPYGQHEIVCDFFGVRRGFGWTVAPPMPGQLGWRWLAYIGDERAQGIEISEQVARARVREWLDEIGGCPMAGP